MRSVKLAVRATLTVMLVHNLSTRHSVILKIAFARFWKPFAVRPFIAVMMIIDSPARRDLLVLANAHQLRIEPLATMGQCTLYVPTQYGVSA